MASGEGFGDLVDFWSEGLPLTIKGKTYVVPEPSAELGLQCQSLFSAGINVMSAMQRGEAVADGIRQMSQLDDDEGRGGGASEHGSSPRKANLDEYGRGQRGANGLYEWYDIPPDKQRELEAGAGEGITWEQILKRWHLVECDLSDAGIDLGDKALVRARSWRWLRTRIVGLLSRDTRLATALAPKTEVGSRDHVASRQRRGSGTRDAWGR